MEDRAQGVPLSDSATQRGGTKSIGGARRSWSGRTTESSLSLGWCPDLLLAIREVDEVIHLQEETVVWKGWGSML